ncbi:hypothetical protein ACFC96_39610 [Streptomyces sp. NPDC055955]|uniref:hypothetical protein n=1 Tax=Streptomyces sp. NPDC055955 TaxID=3345665 RepID=UPI0035D81ED3
MVGRGLGAFGLSAAAVLAAGPAAADGPRPRPVPEVDLAYHGQVAMSGGRVETWLVPQNHGPSPVAGATLRLRWSVPVKAMRGLPPMCVRADTQTVLCGTGALPADSRGRRIRVSARLAGAPSEVTVRIDTLWSAGTADHNPQNSTHKVLALDTGDVYYF